MGNFKRGIFLGSALGAALMWLNATPKGKEMRAKIMTHLDPLYNELKVSIKQLEGPTRDMWDALVERAVEEYSTKKEMADDLKGVLVRKLKKKWNQLEKEIKHK